MTPQNRIHELEDFIAIAWDILETEEDADLCRLWIRRLFDGEDWQPAEPAIDREAVRARRRRERQPAHSQSSEVGC